jgi:2-keto-4-pentenoate hydratase/2-oxohepta-3-ene-1,7-dioic acid hydratase in catechol pathway
LVVLISATLASLDHLPVDKNNAMKLGTCQYQHQTYVCIAAGDQVLIPALDPSVEQSPWRDMLTLIECGIDYAAVAANGTPVMHVPATAITLLAPIPRPRKNVMCLGLNYLEHAEETANQSGAPAKHRNTPLFSPNARPA